MGDSRSRHSRGSGKSALIVEDNPTNAAVIEAHLKGWGMRVTLAVHGRDALQRLREAHGRKSGSMLPSST